ncbi:MAG: class I SAM-dependent methyltransferase [Flavobacteriales bacterium]
MKVSDKIIAPTWKDYELIDCGNGRKLERFGNVVLDRPEIAATGSPHFPNKKWKALTQCKFTQETANSGQWTGNAAPWVISYVTDFEIRFNLELSQFKHVGVFPEQSANWEYIFSALQRKTDARALNLFAYTGGASLAAKAAGADITHVEAFSQLIGKAKENMESSLLSDIRWMREDALKYAQKEVKRQKYYDLIIMDPPSWGRGPKGEKWKLEKHIDELIKGVSALLAPKGHLIVNTYSGISPKELKLMLEKHLRFQKIQVGNLVVKATSGAEFSTGSLVRGNI